MKRTIVIIALLFAFCFTVFAQQSNTPCPEIKLLLPSQALTSGESTALYVTVGNCLTDKYEYFWSVDAGIITGGQGTSKIWADTTGLSGINFTVSVKVKGLPEGCSDIASGEIAVKPWLGCGLIGSFSNLPDNDVRGRLDNFFIELLYDLKVKG